MKTQNKTPNQIEAPQEPQPELPETQSLDGLNEFPKTRVQIGLGLAVFGYVLFLLGARPSLFGLDRSRVIGFVQISVFLIGLALITLGTYLALKAFWPEGKKTIAADIGSRLASTGYVICVFTAMADIFGMGSHRLPNVFFGPLQAQGMSIGMATIALGFLLMVRYKRSNSWTKSESKPEANNLPEPDHPDNKIDLSQSSLT